MEKPWNKEERRFNNRLHDDDIKLIVSGVTNSLDSHYCRFQSIKTEDMEAVVPFMLSFKGVTEKTGMLIWKLIIGTFIVGIFGLIGLGFWNRVGGK